MDIKNKIKDAGISLNEMEADLQKSSPAFIAYTIAAFLLMFITALAVFFFANFCTTFSTHFRFYRTAQLY